MASRENLPESMLPTAPAPHIWAGYEDGHTPDEAASDPPFPPKASEIEGGGLPNIESAGTVSMIILMVSQSQFAWVKCHASRR